MDTKISAFPTIGTLNGLETLPCLQSGVNKIGTLDAYKAYILTGGLATINAISNDAGANSIIYSSETTNTIPYLDYQKRLKSSPVTYTQLLYLQNITGDVQSQINALSTGISWKSACKGASDTNITLSSLADKGGTSLALNDRFLCTAQTDPKENGIWVVGPGVWTRPTDFNGTTASVASAIVPIQQGDYADKAFICTTDNPAKPGTDDLAFDIWGGTTYIGTAGRVSVTGNVIDIDASYIGQVSITRVGTLTTGTWNATRITQAYLNTDVQTLTDAPTITWDVSNGPNAEVTLQGNRTLSITNALAGKTYRIAVRQDATGSRTMALSGSSFVMNAGGGSIGLTTAPDSIDFLEVYFDGAIYYWKYFNDFT